jgi:hypothetical protein
MTLVWRPGFSGLTDADAIAYVSAVETADGQPLEFGVAKAINDFVVGCKLDGIWSAIKASCILAGARTLAGALVPLVGTAPTNNFFLSGDYDRKTGLGDASNTTKYLDSNYVLPTLSQNNNHAAVWKSNTATSSNPYFIGAGVVTPAFNVLALGQNGSYNNSANSLEGGVSQTAQGLHATARSNSTSAFIKRPGTSPVSKTENSLTPTGLTNYVLASNLGGSASLFSTSKFAFYSIGESLDLALLDTRVTALITAIGAAIP